MLAVDGVGSFRLDVQCTIHTLSFFFFFIKKFSAFHHLFSKVLLLWCGRDRRRKFQVVVGWGGRMKKKKQKKKGGRYIHTHGKVCWVCVCVCMKVRVPRYSVDQFYLFRAARQTYIHFLSGRFCFYFLIPPPNLNAVSVIWDERKKRNNKFFKTFQKLVLRK